VSGLAFLERLLPGFPGGALSSVAVLQSERGKRLEVGGERFEAGGLRLEAEDEMPKFKIQMTNDGIRKTSTNTIL
jgi:hypothetical protein